MTINIYPSRLEGEPLEVHKIEKVQTISEWLDYATIGDYNLEAVERHPTIILNGEKVEQSEWDITYFNSSDRLDIYIEAKGDVGIAVMSGLLALLVVMMMSKVAKPRDTSKSKSLEDPDALANQVKWGDPIPEIAGSPITYPDYILPPRKYYIDKTQQWVDSMVCIGVGEYQTDTSQMWLGDTSLPSFGDTAQVQIFQPNEQIPAELSAWWHTPEEVGFTSLGGAGMTLGPTKRVDATWSGSFTFSGQNITGTTAPPENWTTGIILKVEPEHEIYFNGDTLISSVLDTLNINTGDEIELTGARDGNYIVTGVTPATGALVGAPATAAGGSAPSRYDFDTTAAALNITFKSIVYTVFLTTNTTDLSGLVLAINAQLNATPVRARSVGGLLELYQIEPYDGGALSLTGDVLSLMGTVTYTSGTASSPAKGSTYTVAGAAFGTGSEIAAAGRAGMLYTISEITDETVKVSPPDIQFWGGFPSGVLNSSGVQLDEGSIEGGWIGPFAATPKGEKSDAFEIDIFYPQGLIRYDKKNRKRSVKAGGYIEWREIGTTEWQSQRFSNNESIGDQIGFTYTVNHTPGRMEVRVRADSAASSSSSTSDTQQWYGFRSRIIGAPSRYPNLTLAHIRLRSGDKVSGGVDNKFSVRARRILPTVEDPSIKLPTRDIAPFFIHMMESVGYGRNMLDMPTIRGLNTIWVERRDTFDLVCNATSTLKSVANGCLGAGYAELTLLRGKISAVRDAYRLGTPSRIYSPNELRVGGEIVESTESIMPDDIDGVDVEYVDYLTGRTVTEPYRLIGDEGNRVEVIKAVGVTDRTRAWRIAARRRRIAAYRRTVFKGGTEMAAMNSYYMDYVGLQDGIPEYGQSAFVLSFEGLTLTLSEPIQIPKGGAIAMIRRQDGTATVPISITAINGYKITLAAIPSDAGLTSDPNRATVVYIGSRTQIAHEALMTEVRPAGDGTVEFQAVNMDNRVYLEDDLGPDQVILTSRPYAQEHQDAASGVFNTTAELVKMYSDYNHPPSDAAGIDSLIFDARLVNTVFYSDYTAVDAAGIDSINFNAALIVTVAYNDYNHPPSDAAGIDSLIFTANMKKIVIDSTAAPDAATSTYNTEVTLVSK